MAIDRILRSVGLQRRERDPAPEIVRVGATGVAVAANASGNVDLAERLEAAMVGAIESCHAEGILDPEIHRERMMAAREAVLNT
jgi:hypothetical protein